MDSVHLHLMICHVPVVGQAIAFGGLVVAFWKKDASFARWVFALSLLTSLAALPTTWSGRRAEDRVSSLAGISMDAMEAHEESAETALAVTLAAGGVAALTLTASFFREKTIRAGVLLAAIASLIACGFLARTSNLGGLIRHTEIQSDGSGAQLQAP
jgi:hypothetical protein